MTNLFNETRISLTKLAQREKVNICTPWRWTTRGVAGVRLETFSVGHRRYTTSPGAFERWIEAVTAAKSGQPIVSRTSRQREADQQRAMDELRKAGLISEKQPTTAAPRTEKWPRCSGGDTGDQQ